MSFLVEHKEAITTCVHCPRLCRFVCPVAESEKSEVVTPTGLMTLVGQLQKGQYPGAWNDVVDVFDHCTMCGRCTELCVHSQRPQDILLEARVALRRGVSAPEWDAERLRQLRSVLQDAVKRMEGRQGKWLVLGRNLFSSNQSESFFELLESAYQRGVVPLDGFLSEVCRDWEQGFFDAYESLAHLLKEVIDRADVVYTFDAQTEDLVRAFLKHNGHEVRSFRSGWEPLLQLVQSQKQQKQSEEPQVQWMPSCGMRFREKDVQRVGQILDALGMDWLGPKNANDIGCCGGGGYTEELAPNVADWSWMQIRRAHPYVVGDRADCSKRYAEARGYPFATILDLVAKRLGI